MKRELWYSIVVRDWTGKVVSRERRRSRSFVRQWNDIVWCQVTGDGTGTVKDYNNTSRAMAPVVYHLRMDLIATYEDDQSIVIGTGDTAVTVSDYALASRIAHGVGAGQMSYQTPIVNASVVSAPTCGFVVERAFVNNSGSEITVREAGIYSVFALYYFACLVRDVFGTPQAIPNGGSLSVNYTLRVTE